MTADARRRPPLRGVLARRFVLVAALPLLLVVVLWAAFALPEALRRIVDENEQAAELVRGRVGAVLMVPQRALELTAVRLAAAPGERAMHALQQALDSTPAFDELYVANAAGVIEAAAVSPGAGVRASDLLGLDLSARPFYADARERRAAVWSDTFISPLSGRVTAALAVPVGDGRVLVGQIALAGLGQELAVALPGALTVVLDRKGRVLVHPRQQLAAWQENWSHLPLVRAALDGDARAGELELDGVRWLATIGTAEPAGWPVVVAQRQTLLYAPLVRIGWISGLAVALALAIAIVTALRLAAIEAARYRRLLAAASARIDDPARSVVDVDLGSAEAQALWDRLRELLDRLQRQERSATSARRDLQAVLDAATEVAVVATDTHGVIRLFNRGAEKLLGYRADELVGKATLDRLHDPAELAERGAGGAPLDGFRTLLAVAQRHGNDVRDWTYLRRDGTPLRVSLALTAVRDRDGDATGFVAIAIDQTHRLRAAELELARERAEAASEAKSEFLSRVSHELRTPLNAVLGYAQLLAMDTEHGLNTVQREQLRRIETAGWHLVRLIDDVLDLSRIEGGRIALTIEPVNVAKVAADAVRLIAPQAQADQVTIDTRGIDTAAAPVAAADRTRLQQVLLNLLSNAVKYNRRGGRVEVDLLEDDDAAVSIAVSDTGRGMDAQQVARLYAPFDRLGLEASHIQGTGIGLVVTKRLVDLMNGRIDVRSAPGAGTRFTVTLPRAEPWQPTGAAPLEPAAASPDGPGGAVVYVDNDLVNAGLMRDVFALRPGWRLHVAPTLAEGRKLIELVAPRAVLVDMHLPDGNAMMLLDWMRSNALQREIPVIVVSADATPQQRERASAAGATAFVAKPLRVADALRAIDDALGSAARPGTTS